MKRCSTKQENNLMTTAMLEMYRNLVGQQGNNAESCLSDPDSLAVFTRCHNLISDIHVLSKVVKSRPEVYCLNAAETEYQFALSALLTGHYRHSFGALRLTFEMLLHSIYFSGHEVKLNQWLAGNRDLTWGALTDENKGIFSAEFVKAFSPELVDQRKQYAALAATTYRECSQFVHGNPITSNTLSKNLTFERQSLDKWEETMQSMRLCVLYCFLYRYGKQLPIKEAPRFQAIVTESLGHEEAVRQFFESAIA